MLSDSFEAARLSSVRSYFGIRSPALGGKIGTSRTATGSGDLANVQSEPPLPNNRKPGRVLGFFVSAIRAFDVRNTPESRHFAALAIMAAYGLSRRFGAFDFVEGRGSKRFRITN